MTLKTIWSFGYGSNMDVKALEARKGVKVLGKYYIFVARQSESKFYRNLVGIF